MLSSIDLRIQSEIPFRNGNQRSWGIGRRCASRTSTRVWTIVVSTSEGSRGRISITRVWSKISRWGINRWLMENLTSKIYSSLPQLSSTSSTHSRGWSSQITQLHLMSQHCYTISENCPTEDYISQIEKLWSVPSKCSSLTYPTRTLWQTSVISSTMCLVSDCSVLHQVCQPLSTIKMVIDLCCGSYWPTMTQMMKMTWAWVMSSDSRMTEARGRLSTSEIQVNLNPLLRQHEIHSCLRL